jgi:hypothetical protein
MPEPSFWNAVAVSWLIFVSGFSLCALILFAAAMIHAYPVQALCVIIPVSIILTILAVIHLNRA